VSGGRVLKDLPLKEGSRVMCVESGSGCFTKGSRYLIQKGGHIKDNFGSFKHHRHYDFSKFVLCQPLSVEEILGVEM
jgi:hypothetical protein